MVKKHAHSVRQWVNRHKSTLKKAGLGALVLFILAQLIYPGDRMLPFARVDGVAVGAVPKKETIQKLNELSVNQRLNVTFGKMTTTADTPLPADIGLSVQNNQRIEAANYPWLLRFIPTSVLWFGLLQQESTPEYSFDERKADAYLTAKFGETCTLAAKDAMLKLSGETLSLVSSQPGGSCQKDEAIKLLAKAKPRLNKVASVTVPVTVIAPTVGDEEAKQLAESLNTSSKGGVTLKVTDKTQSIPQKEVLSWLVFKPSEAGLNFEIDSTKAGAYLAKTATPLVAKPAGITKVTTVDFTETARQDGQVGQTLALDATLADIASVLRAEKSEASAAVTPLQPKTEFTRSYSKTSTGIAAQLKFYDDDNQGVFGVSFQELGGQGLSAQHNGNRQFVTASTYKLFVAFSTIKKVESGQMSWNDANIASGRDLAKCFDDMIVKSDNPCAEALIKKIGAKELNADIKSLGLGSTAFRADNNVTTANDLANYLTQLEKGTMPIKSENRSRLLAAMKRNVYRQGVPAGASGQVADKVGFLWGLLHDATIVYSPKGTYVLVVLTDGSSWANIADITRKIEALR